MRMKDDVRLQLYQKSQLSTLRADTIRGGRLASAGFYYVFCVLLLNVEILAVKGWGDRIVVSKVTRPSDGRWKPRHG